MDLQFKFGFVSTNPQNPLKGGVGVYVVCQAPWGKGQHT